MNYSLVRQERIKKLEAKLFRISNALRTYPYKNNSDILEDLTAFENTEKEIQIQKAYLLLEA